MEWIKECVWLTMSPAELRNLSRQALERAEDLEARVPPYSLALAGGVRDESYSTVRYGKVYSYTGTAMVTMADGSTWECTGHKPKGTPEVIHRQGWIEFRQVSQGNGGDAGD